MTARPARRERDSTLRWLLLIHHLPPEPLYLRARIRHLLLRVGAMPLKKSVYALPDEKGRLEELERIAAEAAEGDGDAHVCRARFRDPATDAALVERSRQAREADWAELAETLRRWKQRGEPTPSQLARARKRFEEITRIDFFEAAGRREAKRLLESFARPSSRGEKARAAGLAPSPELIGRTWVTRRGVLIDRIASAWFIRRFLDPQARFRFVDPADSAGGPNELRFDMPGGDYTHEEDRCTLETLIQRTGVSDRALEEVARIVHDIDLKDGKFGRPEAPGIERLFTGLLLAHRQDEERLETGFGLFDGLYRSFQCASGTPAGDQAGQGGIS
jgi:hypothetical protein